MSLSGNNNIRRIARWLLAAFVVAWVNIIVQAPVHAAMKQSNDMPCHCDTSLCDTVLSMEEKADDGLGFTTPVIHDFPLAFVAAIFIDNLQSLSAIHLHELAQDFREHHPPPLLLNTILLI